MRISFYILLLITSSLIFNNCKKEQNPLPTNNDSIPTPLDTTHHNTPTYDTIFPGSYYPIYPGSWWTYLINDSVSSTSHATGYFPHSYLVTYPDTYSDTVYVPYLGTTPIYHYKRIEYFFPPFGDRYGLWPILSEQLGFDYSSCFTDTRYGDFSFHKVVKQKTVNNDGDSIIVICGHYIYGPVNNDTSVEIYTKNIGLTYYVKFNKVTHDTLEKKVLIDYYINN